ncbi:MAG: glutamate dehydrogenase, partial [Bdellovibrionales bacterium]|nr:glutamate dehydrogenase [Bdellovibrionales bacterium]
AVSSENAGSIKTKMVVEAANIPVTNNGDRILVERGIPVIPDILANAGGVVVSYLEWASNHQRFAYPKSKVAEFLIQNLNSAWLEVYGTSETENLSYRDASYLISVNRVCKAMEMRGFF